MAPTLSWSDLVQPAGQSRAVATGFPADQPETVRRYTYNGSAAIHAALQDMELEHGAGVLLPAYCCGAELGPFEQRACTLYFHDVTPHFQVRAEDIERILSAHADIRVMLLTHYLGLPQPEVDVIAEHCRQHGVCLIEDCAHALYTETDGRSIGQSGDYAIFSMRKTLPLSEGGALVGRRALTVAADVAPRTPSFIASLSRLAYSFQQGARSGVNHQGRALQRYLTLGLWALPAVLAKLARVTGLVPAHRWLTPDVEGEEAYPVFGQGISGFSRRLLECTDGSRVRALRRHNHARWVTRVTGMPGVGIVHRDLPDGVCPLYFLVSVTDPGGCVKRLAERDIEAFNWWQHLSPRIAWGNYPVARQLKQSLLALPLHQGLEEADIEHMAHCLSIAVGTGES